MFEATHSEHASAEGADVWALWSDLGRWPDWNEQIEGVEVEGELRVGAELELKMRRGGTVRFELLELEPGSLLAYEARFPGARLAHRQRLAAHRSSVEISHGIRLSGPLSGFWALMMGRRRMRESVERFVVRERELVERPGARSRSSSGRA